MARRSSVPPVRPERAARRAPMLSRGMTGYLGMDLPRFLALVRARRWLILGIVVAATVLALVWSLTQPNRYDASADLLFGRTTSADSIITGGATDTADVPERTAATNLALASLDSVAANVKRRFRGPVTAQQLKDAVTVEAQGASDVVTVSAEWDSPAQAAALANAFADEIVAVRRETAQADIQRAIDAATARVPAAPKTPAETALADSLQAKIADLETLKAATTGNVHIVERATPPDHRSAPKPLRNAVIAAVVAAILALFVVVLLARFDDRIGDEDELAALLEAPVLARIPEVGRSQAAHPRLDPRPGSCIPRGLRVPAAEPPAHGSRRRPGGRRDEPRRRRRQEHGGGMAGPVAGPQRRGGRGRRSRSAQARAAHLSEHRTRAGRRRARRAARRLARRQRRPAGAPMPRRRRSSTRRIPSRRRRTASRPRTGAASTPTTTSRLASSSSRGSAATRAAPRAR